MEEKKKTSKRYSAEVRERAVRLLREVLKDHASEWAAIKSISSKIGCSGAPQGAHRRGWLRQAEREGGSRDGMTTEDRARMKALEREVRELKVARRAAGTRSCARRQHILRRCGPQGGSAARSARPPVPQMIAFIDDHRNAHGVGAQRSSRSAGFCRSPHPATTPAKFSSAILTGVLTERGARREA